MIDHETGFIKIEQFSVTTDNEFRTAAEKLKAQGMKKLILDLRNNAGGVMQSATKVADEFLAANKLIVSTKGKHSKERLYKATAEGILEKTQVVVLINENSASASEIVAGALQDQDRAEIVGRRSFGKGLVQEDMRLRDNSSLRLTVARYYTPTGRSIQKPYNGNIEEYYHDRIDRYDNGELYAPDSSKFVDSLKFVTPKGKVVYGGGGIMPDVFVPLDTVSDALLNDFIRFSEKEFKVKVNQEDLKTSRELIKNFLKAEIARQIWTENGYYTVMNRFDKEVQKALESF
ncbi:peptidase, S41 family [Ancylostoma ceylanicum]|uniref:Peptidase, S41 family n=1 Tax=Ancylostoma ceylanicum TaxID=53326 RepID=A0A0D6L8S1_9BILA|nr:peptidase, S41 family [Ancylostoma ceylanicum]